MEQYKSMNCTAEGMLRQYGQYLKEEERSRATAEKYIRGVRKFEDYLHRCGGEGLDKESVLGYKQYLREHYKTTSVNSMLAAVNSFLEYMDRGECRVKLLKIRQVQFSDKEEELTEKDCARLVHTAERKGDIRMSILLQTIGSTGVRISELPFITVGSLETGRAGIYNEGKSQVASLSAELMKILKNYCWKVGIQSGSIFTARNGKLMDRSNVSKWIRLLGREVRVDMSKVFPHNSRHLFARVFYSTEKDVVRLMDLLGHPNISTTRIYTTGTGEQPKRQMSRVQLVLG